MLAAATGGPLVTRSRGVCVEVTPSLLDLGTQQSGELTHTTLLWFRLPSHGVGAAGPPRCPNSPQRAITLSSSSSSSLQSRGRPQPPPCPHPRHPRARR